MTSVTFVHDHKLIISKGAIYSQGGLSKTLINTIKSSYRSLIETENIFKL